jgi:Lon protease-like protein
VSHVVLPIFPLPDVTFFPGTLLPLHVFEARYRFMIADALERDHRLAVAQLKPGYEKDYGGKPAVYEVMGAGEIVSVERLPTGRYDIVLKGDMRIRIVRELPTDTLYRVVLAEVIDGALSAGDTRADLARVRAACRALLAALDRPRNLLDSVLADDQPAGLVADRVASGIVPSAKARQELLETLDVGVRLMRLASTLEDLVRDLKGGRE